MGNRMGQVVSSRILGMTAADGTILLRAPGLGGIEDGRPLHAVTGPVRGQRTSLGFRMDTSAPARSGNAA